MSRYRFQEPCYLAIHQDTCAFILHIFYKHFFAIRTITTQHHYSRHLTTSKRGLICKPNWFQVHWLSGVSKHLLCTHNVFETFQGVDANPLFHMHFRVRELSGRHHNCLPAQNTFVSLKSTFIPLFLNAFFHLECLRSTSRQLFPRSTRLSA